MGKKKITHVTNQKNYTQVNMTLQKYIYKYLLDMIWLHVFKFYKLVYKCCSSWFHVDSKHVLSVFMLTMLFEEQ